MGKSDLLKFIERYKGIKMSHSKLKGMWDKLSMADFGYAETKQEVFEWLQEYRKAIAEKKVTA